VSQADRQVAIVTGVGRRAGIGAAIATRLAEDGWDIATTYWPELDREMYGQHVEEEADSIVRELEGVGARARAIEVDLGVSSVPDLFDDVERTLGGVSALIINHTHCVVNDLLHTSPESLDRHLAVNVRSVLLLIQEFARRFTRHVGAGRIVTITGDHTVGNVAYGVSKGAADRITSAAAYELGAMGITANAVNPGPIDTGWMNDDHRAHALRATPLQRLATPADAANLVSFLCSERGGWITGQLLYSNGGFRGTIG
jgi:3-oxoacyl-[acyl-carrier protein] reductase